MAVLPESLLAENGGIIEGAHMFPGVSEPDVLARLRGYLDEGYTYAVVVGSEDAAATAWAYYKALTAVVTRMASRPSTLGVIGEGYRAYTSEQIRTLQNQAATWLATFESYAEPETEADVLDSYPVHFSDRRIDA
jgi:hypothetical protein